MTMSAFSVTTPVSGLSGASLVSGPASEESRVHSTARRPSAKIRAHSEYLRTAARLRARAVAMQAEIDRLAVPSFQGMRATRRRDTMNARRARQHAELQKIQRILYALADQQQGGDVPECLRQVRTKADVLVTLSWSTWPDTIAEGSANDWRISEQRKLERAGMTPSTLAQARAALLQLSEETPAQRVERERAARLETLYARVKYGGIPDYFPTPPAVAAVLLSRARIQPGMCVLEPSAGSGELAEAVLRSVVSPQGVKVDCIERLTTLQDILILKGLHVLALEDHGADFLLLPPVPEYDRVVMNPPFSAECEHVRRAYEWLRPGGRLVTVMCRRIRHRTDRVYREFASWLDARGACIEDLPDDAFSVSQPPTSTSTVVVTIDKP